MTANKGNENVSDNKHNKIKQPRTKPIIAQNTAKLTSDKKTDSNIKPKIIVTQNTTKNCSKQKKSKRKNTTRT